MQMLPGHLVCGFVGISGGDESCVLLLPVATAAKLDLVYVQDTHDVSRWDQVLEARQQGSSDAHHNSVESEQRAVRREAEGRLVMER